MARRFVLGPSAGSITLTGEGLQPVDGHSHLIASTNPAVIAYDPAFAFEISHIVQDGLRRMYGSSPEHPHGEDVFYYVTIYNEPYQQPAEPAGVDADVILKCLYRYPAAPEGPADRSSAHHLALS